MVLVPAGTFLMGSADGEKDESPPHTVDLAAFLVDRTEVTNAAYALFWRADGGAESPHTPAGFEGNGSAGWPEVARLRPDHPVVGVTWFGAEAYCRWTGRRLPTEAEWEKAARGTDGRVWPWGNDVTPDSTRANLHGEGDGYPRSTAPAGAFPPGASPFGALDMAGNVWEWVSDWYGADFYAKSPRRNPKGPDRGGVRTLRGGSWRTARVYARTTYRNSSFLPTEGLEDVGFRCAKDVRK